MGIAVLSASEASIYGRYGFGVATRRMELAINTARFRFRDDVEVATGHVEFVHPSFLQSHFDRITSAHQERYRGEPVAIRALSRLMATDLPPVNLAHF